MNLRRLNPAYNTLLQYESQAATCLAQIYKPYDDSSHFTDKEAEVQIA